MDPNLNNHFFEQEQRRKELFDKRSLLLEAVKQINEEIYQLEE
jgi:hypothetical protein